MAKGKRKPRDVAAITQIVREELPAIAHHDAGERDRLLAAAASKRLADKITPRYIAPFRKLVEDEMAEAGRDRPDDVIDDARGRYLARIARLEEFIESRMGGLPPEMFGAYVGAIKALFDLARERARYEGVKPPDDEDKSGEVHLHLHFDPDPEPDGD